MKGNLFLNAAPVEFINEYKLPTAVNYDVDKFEISLCTYRYKVSVVFVNSWIIDFCNFLAVILI